MGYPFKRIWKTKANQQDYLGIKHTSGLQYAIRLSDGSVMSSYASKVLGRTDTVFIKWSPLGSLITAMQVLYGGHGGTFGYDEKTNTIYSYRDNVLSNLKEIISFNYTPNTNLNFDQGTHIATVNEYTRANVDTPNNKYVTSNYAGKVSIGELSNWEEQVSLNIFDYKLDPQINTIQATALAYPYLFITSGNVDNKDPRLITCVNVETKQLIFQDKIVAGKDIKAFTPLSLHNHLEPEGIYWDYSKRELVVGFNKTERDFLMKRVHSELYSTNKYNRYLPRLIN